STDKAHGANLPRNTWAARMRPPTAAMANTIKAVLNISFSLATKADAPGGAPGERRGGQAPHHGSVRHEHGMPHVRSLQPPSRPSCGGGDAPAAHATGRNRHRR